MRQGLATLSPPPAFPVPRLQVCVCTPLAEILTFFNKRLKIWAVGLSFETCINVRSPNHAPPHSVFIPGSSLRLKACTPCLLQKDSDSRWPYSVAQANLKLERTLPELAGNIRSLATTLAFPKILVSLKEAKSGQQASGSLGFRLRGPGHPPCPALPQPV